MRSLAARKDALSKAGWGVARGRDGFWIAMEPSPTRDWTWGQRVIVRDSEEGVIIAVEEILKSRGGSEPKDTACRQRASTRSH